MLIRRLKEHSIELIDIEPIEAELLRQVPGVCESGGDSRSEARLFSSPADSSESQFLNDWAEYVRPELRHLFLSARNTVKEDLEKLSNFPGRLGRLVVPRDTQRRLAERLESSSADPGDEVQFQRPRTFHARSAEMVFTSRPGPAAN